MKILKIYPVQKNDIAARRNPEINAKNYFNASFEHNEKTYTATIRIATNYIASCINEENAAVRLKEETQNKIIRLIEEYNKKRDTI